MSSGPMVHVWIKKPNEHNHHNAATLHLVVISDPCIYKKPGPWHRVSFPLKEGCPLFFPQMNYYFFDTALWHGFRASERQASSV